MLGPRWQDVELGAGTLTVRNAKHQINDKPTLVESKTSRLRRTVNLPNSAVIALRPRQDRQRFARQVAGNRWHEWGLVFASTIGTPLGSSNVTHHFQRLLAAAGLPRQRFHDPRHCRATLMLEQHVPGRVVMEVLGHSRISLTLDTYSHMMPAMRRDAADLLDALLTDAS